MVKTADGRDLSREEWRTIPEFPNYKITADGDVKHIRLGHLLTESQVGNTNTWAYHLWKKMPNGTSKGFRRTFQGLVWDAFPELKPKKPVREGPKRKYVTKGEWRVVPDFPLFEFHEEGLLRYKNGRRYLNPELRLDGSKFWRLRKPGEFPNQHAEKVVVTEHDLRKSTFPERFKEAA